MSLLVPSITEIAESLFLGNLPSSWNLKTLKSNSITSLVSLTETEYGLWTRLGNKRQILRSRRLQISCLDNMTMDPLPRMADICDFIDAQLARPVPVLPDKPFSPSDDSDSIGEPTNDDIHNAPAIPGRVLVHCQQGVSRSAAVVIVYLTRKRRERPDVVLANVKPKRKIRPNENFLEQLKVWAEVEYEVWEDEERKVPNEPYRAYLERRAERLKERDSAGDEPIGIISLDGSPDHHIVSGSSRFCIFSQASCNILSPFVQFHSIYFQTATWQAGFLRLSFMLQ